MSGFYANVKGADPNYCADRINCMGLKNIRVLCLVTHVKSLGAPILKTDTTIGKTGDKPVRIEFSRILALLRF